MILKECMVDNKNVLLLNVTFDDDEEAAGGA